MLAGNVERLANTLSPPSQTRIELMGVKSQ